MDFFTQVSNLILQSTVVIFIELILGNALTKFVLSNTMKEKSKTRYENHIP